MRLLASSVVLLAAANVWGFQATPQRQLRRPLITTTQLGLADEINEYRRGLSVTDAKGDKQTEKVSLFLSCCCVAFLLSCSLACLL